MKFTYAPKDGEPQPFDIDLDDLSTEECELLEEAGGTQWDTYGKWVQLVNTGGFRATRVVLWLCLRRINPGLGFEEVRPRLSELQFDIPDDVSQPEPAVESGEPGKSETGDESTSSP